MIAPARRPRQGGAGFFAVRFFPHRFKSGAGILIPAGQFLEFLLVGFLVLGDAGVSGDGLLHQSRNHRKLLRHPNLIGIQFLGFTDSLLHKAEVGKNLVTVCSNPVHHPEKSGFQLILAQMRRFAALFVFELGVALPDDPAVLVVAVPDL